MDFVQAGRGKSHGINGWKRAAHVNSIVLGVVTLLLIAFLAVAIRQAHGTGKSLLFYEGTCDGGSATRVNATLHLLLNVVSTAIFASSNFFMQVLNSPSREEVDRAHVAGLWMGIGVSSARNAFRVSKFKTCCWVLFLISSIPLHLLFNSMIFQTDQRNSEYDLTIASEGFVNNAEYYMPGASLTVSGYFQGYGNGYVVSEMAQFVNHSQEFYQNVSTMAGEGSQWDKLSFNDCFNEYVACGGIRSHRNVIVVAAPKDEWARDDVWHLLPNQTETWDPIVPAHEPNSLWFYAPCTVRWDPPVSASLVTMSWTGSVTILWLIVDTYHR
jgi:hypothetical protein